MSVKNKQTRISISKALSQVPLFASLNNEEIGKIVSLCRQNGYKKGAEVITEGEEGNCFYIIAKGRANVVKDGKVIAFLGKNDYFGERALLTHEPRSASIFADSELECLEIVSKDFQKLMAESAFELRFAQRQAITSPNTKVLLEEMGELTREDRKFVFGADTKAFLLKAVPFDLFSSAFSEEEKNFVVEHMTPKNLAVGEEAIAEGEFGSEMFVIHSGEVVVLKKGQAGKVSNGSKFFPKGCKKSPEVRKLATLGNGDYFGELALLYKCARTASVVATRPTLLYVLPNFLFRLALAKQNIEEQAARVSFLHSVPVLRSLLSHEYELLARNLEEIHFLGGKQIIAEGTKGNAFFLVKSGELDVHKGEEKVARLKRGDFFGEAALLTHETRNASVFAATDCVCFVLTKEVFDELLGPLHEIIKDSASQRTQANKEKTRAATEALEKRATAAMADLDISQGAAEFDVLEILGRGAFGTVKLARHKKTGRLVALKFVSVQEVEKSKTISHLRSEKNSLKEVRGCGFIVDLFHVFLQGQDIVFVTEVAEGGELFAHLRNCGKFVEKDARFYVASVVLAFEHLQTRSYVYRDLKPENIVMFADGSVKLIDLGFAKKLGVGGKTFTLCGTPDYIAPEVITGAGHDFKVDLWTLGVLSYELCAGYPPFRANDELGLFTEILHREIKFPSGFSSELKSFIKKLTKKKPGERLGAGADGIAAVKKHEWFRNFDWEELAGKRMVAPMKPKPKKYPPKAKANFLEDMAQALGNLSANELPVWTQEFDDRNVSN